VTARRASLVVVAALLVTAVWVARRVPPSPPPVAEAPAAAAAPAWTPPPPPPTVVAADEPSADLAADPVAPGTASLPTDAVRFAAGLADALCACTDGACVDEVNARHAAGLGVVGATTDARALHDAFVRARACTDRVRAAGS